MDQSQSPRNFSHRSTPVPAIETNGSRASSARNSLAGSRPGSARKEPEVLLNSSVNFSSARQRRHSNSSQRSGPIASPRVELKQSNSSSVFNALSPRHDADADGFFTDQDQIRSVDVNDEEWNETRQWVDELHRLNSSFTTRETPPPPSAPSASAMPPVPLGMSRDSLGGTMIPPPQPTADDQRMIFIPLDDNADAEQAAKRIQRWYRKQRSVQKSKETKVPPVNHRRPPTPPPSRSISTTSSLSSKGRNSATASPRVDQRTSSVNGSVASRITYDGLCEALKKLEEVEPFPPQAPLREDSVYLNVDPLSDSSTLSEPSAPPTPKFTGLATSPKINETSTRTIRSAQDLRERIKTWRSDDFEAQLQAQKDEYQASIQRHIRFLDQVNQDKKQLTARCKQLEDQMRAMEKKYESRIKSLQESHRLDLQRFKDTQAAAEKTRRELWVEEKTKKLKELTVRGLEPEIQKLIQKHKDEIEELKKIHQAELISADERASQRYIRLTDELREELEREKQQAIARERELARDRYEKAIAEERETFLEQRKKLFAEIEEEKSRQMELVHRQRTDLEKLRRDFEEKQRSIDEEKRSLTIKEQQIRQERDREVEQIRKDLEREFDERINHWKEKCESAERQTHDLKSALTETQADRDRFQRLFNEKERVIETFQDERQRLENVVREEMADRTMKMEEENRRLKVELAEARAREKLAVEKKNQEVEQLREKQDRELETLQEKIKQAVVKKDEQVQALRRQYEAVMKRCEQLETTAGRKTTRKQ